MDSLGNVIAGHYYELNGEACWYLAVGLEVTADNNVIAWGAGEAGAQKRIFALRVDSTGEVVWARDFDQVGSFQFIKELPSGDLLAGINVLGVGAVLARMDANGTIIWSRSYVQPRGVVHDAVVGSDSSFIITGSTDTFHAYFPDPLPAGYDPRLFMMKLNGAGDVQWCKGYDVDPYVWYTSQFSRIERTNDGNYVVLANIGYRANGLNYDFFSRPLLMKTDLNGDTLWTRAMGANSYAYRTADLLAYSDSGFVFSGIVWGDLPLGNTGLPYVIKTDPLGHYPCAEQPQAMQVMDLFPTDSSITLTSVDGATMYPLLVGDTIFDPLIVFDGCAITTQIRAVPQRRYRLYPNPNTGHFTVEFPDPLRVDCSYAVYDALGRLLLQRPLAKGQETEEIDLSRFGKGTYLIRFNTPDDVCHERVVVQ
ncbi:MAG: T9SS type A sorting domain-containing protein [Flavobacteriales bacterium]|nr:T9SS type A sorting domain-containing protein [Flavobacteriales bacterium]MCB9167500.1 T9SS type A sorting domain-containing protein [Flavobacteriales bacterium]